MLKELVVNSAPHETRVALLENGTIVEVFIEREDETSIAGNIYKGRVQRVLPGMQAAFVDIGFDQAAFIYVDDVLDTASYTMYQKFEQDNDVEGDSESNGRAIETTDMEANHNSWKTSLNSDCSIEDLLTEGQEIMVQVAKSSIGSKGPRVTTHISLPGRYMVLLPTVDHIGISKKIGNETERTRLKDLLLSIRKNNFGYILRTQAQGIDKETIKKEVNFLTKTWEDILKKNKTAS
ncbi:MAG: Rne/Rng family ribonuclease, partial [Desulfobacula sp.]|nr:Rne/Rng family ribonuclease [Desulfobacula sp.]